MTVVQELKDQLARIRRGGWVKGTPFYEGDACLVEWRDSERIIHVLSDPALAILESVGGEQYPELLMRPLALSPEFWPARAWNDSEARRRDEVEALLEKGILRAEEREGLE